MLCMALMYHSVEVFQLGVVAACESIIRIVFKVIAKRRRPVPRGPKAPSFIGSFSQDLPWTVFEIRKISWAHLFLFFFHQADFALEVTSKPGSAFIGMHLRQYRQLVTNIYIYICIYIVTVFVYLVCEITRAI